MKIVIDTRIRQRYAEMLGRQHQVAFLHRRWYISRSERKLGICFTLQSWCLGVVAWVHRIGVCLAATGTRLGLGRRFLSAKRCKTGCRGNLLLCSSSETTPSNKPPVHVWSLIPPQTRASLSYIPVLAQPGQPDQAKCDLAE